MGNVSLEGFTVSYYFIHTFKSENWLNQTSVIPCFCMTAVICEVQRAKWSKKTPTLNKQSIKSQMTAEMCDRGKKNLFTTLVWNCKQHVPTKHPTVEVVLFSSKLLLRIFYYYFQLIQEQTNHRTWGVINPMKYETWETL